MTANIIAECLSFMLIIMQCCQFIFVCTYVYVCLSHFSVGSLLTHAHKHDMHVVALTRMQALHELNLDQPGQSLPNHAIECDSRSKG